MPTPSDIGDGDVQHHALAVETSERDGLVIVAVAGEIDLDSVPVLRLALEGVDDHRQVVVDCAQLRFMDSTGLHLIVTQAQRLNAGGGSLRLRHTSFPVRHVVEITGLIQLFEVDG